MTKSEYQELVDYLGTKFNKIDQRFESIERRFESIDQRFELINRRFSSLNPRFEAVNPRFEFINWRFGSIDRRLDLMDMRFCQSRIRSSERVSPSLKPPEPNCMEEFRRAGLLKWEDPGPSDSSKAQTPEDLDG